MYSTRDLVGLAALIAAVPVVVGQAVTSSSSLQSNFSLTSVRSSATPLPTNFCCFMVAEAVGLNYWWSSTRGPYTATVVTSYIEYDNTVVTELATITQPLNLSTSGWLGPIPSDIINTDNEYRGTVLASFSTVVTYPTTTIASPTPHLVINAFDLFTGTRTTNTAGSSSCKISYTGTIKHFSTADRFTLPTAYIQVEDPPVTRTDSAFLPPPPTDIVASLLSQRDYVTASWPFIRDCPIISGTGQPTVHIPVTALTSSSSTTVRRAGNAPGATSSSGDQTTQEPEPPAPTTEPTPAPTTAPADPPATSNQSETPPTTTQAPQEPEPTEPANPPASTVVDPPSPPEDTPTPPENTQAPPQNSQAPPQNTQAPPENTQAPPENTPAPPANTAAPQNPAPTTAGNTSPTDVANSPAPGNTQPPAESGGSAPQPSDAVPPPAGPVAPINTPSLPFPIVPVPVPTAAPTGTDEAPPTEDTPPTNDTPTNNGGSSPTTTSVTPGAVVLPGDQTLNPGQQTTISGVVISVPSPAVPESGATAPVVIVDGTTFPAAQPTAPPLVVVDGTTVTLPVAAPTSTDSQVDQPVVPITVGSQVLTLEAPSASGEGIVLPNSETLELGATTVVDEQTLIATVVTEGTSVATVIEVADENTTQFVTLPTAIPTESGDESEESSTTSTGPEASEFTGAAMSRVSATWGWGLVNAVGLAVLGFA